MSEQQQAPQMDAEQGRQFAMIEPEGGQTYTPDGEPVPEPAVSGAHMMGALLALVFGMLADRRGEHWRLTESEATELAKTGGAVLDHYMPTQTGPLSGFALCLGVALTPRLMVERQLAAKRTEQEQADGEGATNGDKPE